MPAADVLVMTEDDARFEVELRTSRSGEQAIITSASRDTTEVRLIPMADPEREPVVWRRAAAASSTGPTTPAARLAAGLAASSTW